MSTQPVADHIEAASSTTSRLVLGVDDAERTSGALLWTCAEAARSRLPVELVSACPLPLAHPPMRHAEHTIGDRESSVAQSLARLVTRLPHDVETLPYRVASGQPDRVLLDALDDASALLVVGSSRGHLPAMLLGSTSAAVAAKAPVPVVIVPDGWTEDTESAPLVIGTALSKQPEDHLLRFAFERARHLDVALVVVHAWEVPTLYAWSPADVRDYRSRALAALDQLLEPWAGEYPDVEVAPSAVADQPADAVLDAGKVAHMVIVGPHAPSSHHTGMRLGSTTRKVLQRAGVPVTVVPLPPASQPERRGNVGPTWAPTF